MSKDSDALKLLFEAMHPKGLTATDIARVDKSWLNAPLDELEDKGIIKGKYELIDGIWFRVYRLSKCFSGKEIK
jgi:hypothetical protein